MERRSRAGSRDVTPLHLAFTGLRVLQKTGENRRYKRRLELRTGFAIGGLSTTELQPTPTGMKVQRPRSLCFPLFFLRNLKTQKDARGVEEPRGTHRHDAVAFTPLRRPKEQRAKRRGTRGVEDPRGKQT